MITLLTTFILLTGAYASVGTPGPLAKVSFEYAIGPKGQEDFSNAEALTVLLFEDGVIQVESDEKNTKSSWFKTPLLKQLSYDEFSKLASTVYVLGEAKLVFEDSTTVCRMMPPAANSDLFLSGYKGEFQMVLSDYGCWRGLSVRPASDQLTLAAENLRKKLISIGKELLLR